MSDSNIVNRRTSSGNNLPPIPQPTRKRTKKRTKKKKSTKKIKRKRIVPSFRRGNVFLGSSENPLPPKSLETVELPNNFSIISTSSDDDSDFKKVEEIITPAKPPPQKKKKKKNTSKKNSFSTRKSVFIQMLDRGKKFLSKSKSKKRKKVKSYNELSSQTKSVSPFANLNRRKREEIERKKKREETMLALIRQERMEREKMEAEQKLKEEQAKLEASKKKKKNLITIFWNKNKKKYIDFERSFHSSSYKLLLSTLLVIAVVYNNYSVPYVISFETYSHWTLRIFNILFDILFYINILINIIIKPVEYNNRLKGIFSYIFSMRFIIELTCVLIPIDWIIDIPYLRMPRLLSIVMFFEYLRPLESKLEMYVNLIFFRIIKYCFFLILLIHYFSCIWFYIAKMDSNYNNFIVPTTLSKPLMYNVLMEPPMTIGLVQQSFDYSWTRLKQFFGSLFFGSYYIVGFSAPFPQDLLQCIYSVFVVICGAGIFAIIIGTVSSIFNSLGKTEQIFQEKMQNIREFMKHKKVNGEIQKHVNSYYSVLETSGRAIVSPELVFNDLDIALKRKVNLFLHRDLVKKVKIFEQSEKLTNGLFIGDVCNYLKYILLLKGFTAVRYGEIGKTMYFIGSGEIDVISKEGKLIVTLKKGDLFGEIALFLKRKRTASCVARKTCELYELHWDDLEKILKIHHQCRALFYKEARRKLLQLRAEERRHKRLQRQKILKEERKKAKKKGFVDLQKIVQLSDHDSSPPISPISKMDKDYPRSSSIDTNSSSFSSSDKFESPKSSNSSTRSSIYGELSPYPNAAKSKKSESSTFSLPSENLSIKGKRSFDSNGKLTNIFSPKLTKSPKFMKSKFKTRRRRRRRRRRRSNSRSKKYRSPRRNNNNGRPRGISNTSQEYRNSKDYIGVRNLRESERDKGSENDLRESNGSDNDNNNNDDDNNNDDSNDMFMKVGRRVRLNKSMNNPGPSGHFRTTKRETKHNDSSGRIHVNELPLMKKGMIEMNS